MSGRPTTLRWSGLPASRGPVRSREAARDMAALERVYMECRTELHRYICSIVHDSDLADEVLQSVMLRAITALRDDTRDFELRPWLFRVAHNDAIDRLRRARPTAELDASLVATGLPTPELAEQHQRIQQLWIDLSDLGERQRQALILRELQGMGHEEIAAVLGTSARSVKQTIFEARRALLECSEGRDMHCDDVQRTLSDGDGRARRGRRMRAHLADCQACRSFADGLRTRPADLAVLFPVVPMAAGAAIATLFPGTEGAAHAATSTLTAGGSAAGGAGGATAAGGATGAVTTGGALAATGSSGLAGASGSLAAIVTAKAVVVAVAGATVIGSAGAVAVNRSAGNHAATQAPPPVTSSAAGAAAPAAGSGVAAPSAAASAATPDAARPTSPASKGAAKPTAAAQGKDKASTGTAGAKDRAPDHSNAGGKPERPASSGGKDKAQQPPAKAKSGAAKSTGKPEQAAAGGGAEKSKPVPAQGKPSTPPAAAGNPPANANGSGAADAGSGQGTANGGGQGQSSGAGTQSGETGREAERGAPAGK